MGLAYEYLTFNGKSSRDFEVWISGEGTFDAPERDVENISIPGRNGDLHIDNGRYKNMPITYPAFITSAFRHNFDAFKAYMLAQHGYKRLEDSYNPEYFRLAEYKNAISPKMSTLNRAGSFDIVFDCDPRRFLNSGESVEEFTTSGTINNPTLYDALPLMRVHGIGIISVGGTAIHVISNNDYIDIDCDIQEAYKGATSYNDNIKLADGDFPSLHGGINDVKLLGFTYSAPNSTPTATNYPAYNWTTDELKAKHVGETYINRANNSVYQWQKVQDGVLVTFNDQCKTESIYTDYVYLYYERDGQWYRSERLGGGRGSTTNNIAGRKIFVPSNTFYLWWHTDSSIHENYGYKIDSVQYASEGESDFESINTPTHTWQEIQVGTDSLPESSHPYGDNEDAYYKVVSNTSDAGIYKWVKTTWEFASEENNKTLTKVEITPRWWTV